MVSARIPDAVAGWGSCMFGIARDVLHEAYFSQKLRPIDGKIAPRWWLCCPFHSRAALKSWFPKASGLWWVGFREGKALSDLALTQPSPSKPLAFPPPPPLNSPPCVKFRVASAWIMGFPPLLPPARYLGFDLFAPGRKSLPCAVGIVQGKPYLITQPIDCPGKTLSWP